MLNLHGCSLNVYQNFVSLKKKKTAKILHEGESSKRVQTFVVFVLSLRSSSSSSCSVRRWRLLANHDNKQNEDTFSKGKK